MGIRGLTTFLDINSQLLTDLKLRDCRIVIDGNNLFHFLYNLYHLSDGCGGDYDAFSTATRSFFTTLQQCAIHPFVVFDGPYNPREKKIQISIRRAKERISTTCDISAGHKGRATPILCQDVFVSVLVDMGIQYSVCDGEADSELAALANKYSWPVLSNDSDFFIYNLRAGVILLDYLNLEMHPDTDDPRASKFIKAQIYYFRELHQHFSMDEDLISLFGTLFGNDRVRMSTFETFFTRFSLSKQGSNKLFSGKKQSKMLAILHWLESAGNLETAVGKVLQCYKLDDREKLRDLIMSSVNSYKIGSEPSSHILKLLDDTVQAEPSGLRTLPGHKLPDWFLTELHQGQVSVLSINAMVCRRVILLSQPENFTLPSGHNCAKPLREILYGILVQYDLCYHDKVGGEACPDGCSAECQKKRFVEEIDRDLKRQKRYLVEPRTTVDDQPVPSLHDIPNMEESTRIKFLCTAFGIDPEHLAEFPDGLELFFMCVIYWINHAEPKVDLLHLYSVLVSFIKLSILDAQEIDSSSRELNISTSIKSGNFADITRFINKEDVLLIEEEFERLCRPSRNKNQAIQAGVNSLHISSQLQSCMLAGQALNQALGSPLARINVAAVYNGTLIFNTHQELRARVPEKHLGKILGEEKILVDVIDSLKSMIERRVGSLVYELDSEIKSKKKKKAVKKVEQTESSGSDNESVEEKKLKMLTKCKIINRFDCLLLDE